MAKLYFRYSAMDAGKTLDLLKVAYNYADRDQNTLILTSLIDRRSGDNQVMSRVGLVNQAISTTVNDNLFKLVKQQLNYQPIACILVDEVQFFSITQILELSDIVDYLNLPVICYGLRNDYRGQPFPATTTLLAIADTLEEVKTVCYCGRKANFNMLVKNNVAIKEGPPIIIDNDQLTDTKYISVCRKHWKEGKWQL